MGIFISTKHLYLIQLQKLECKKHSNCGNSDYSFSKDIRYSLARKGQLSYIDIFTNDEYKGLTSAYNINEEYVMSAQELSPSKKYIRLDDAQELLEQLNSKKEISKTKILHRNK
jgi:hypothetical protein